MDCSLNRINLITVLGCFLASVSLSNVWFSVETFTENGNNVVFNFSPLIRVIWIASESPISQVFYRLDTSLIGVAIIFGSIFSIFGSYLGKDTTASIGGIIVLTSTLLFPSTLPAKIPLGRALSIKWCFAISITGSCCLFVSAIIFLDVNSIVKKFRGVSFIIKYKTLSIVNPERYVYRLVEILGILGGIYTSYELYRLIRKVLYLGSITLSLGDVPFLLYRIELFICLFTFLFLSLYILYRFIFKHFLERY